MSDDIEIIKKVKEKIGISKLSSDDNVSGTCILKETINHANFFGIKDPKSLVSFVLNSLSASKSCDYYGGGFKLDLQNWLKLQSANSSLDEIEYNVKLLKDAALIIRSAFSTYNRNHPKNSPLSMNFDDSGIFTLHQKLTYDQIRDLMGYIFSNDIDRIIEDKNEDRKDIARLKIEGLQL